MKLKKLLDLMPILTELKPDINLYPVDGEFWIDVHRENYNKWVSSVFYSVYDDPDDPFIDRAEDLEDHREELEEHGFPFDEEWYMDADDARELRDLAKSANMAVDELFSDEIC